MEYFKWPKRGNFRRAIVHLVSELWNPLSNLVQIYSDILKVLTKTFHMWHRAIDIVWAIKNADFLETPK